MAARPPDAPAAAPATAPTHTLAKWGGRDNRRLRGKGYGGSWNKSEAAGADLALHGWLRQTYLLIAGHTPGTLNQGGSL